MSSLRLHLILRKNSYNSTITSPATVSLRDCYYRIWRTDMKVSKKVMETDADIFAFKQHLILLIQSSISYLETTLSYSLHSEGS